LLYYSYSIISSILGGKENGERVTDRVQAEVQVERNRVRACVIFPFIISSIPKFILIIHISTSYLIQTCQERDLPFSGVVDKTTSPCRVRGVG
jgi:hypothetical protein